MLESIYINYFLEKGRPNMEENKRVYGYINKLDEEVKVAFKDGKAMKGKLLFSGKYEIYLEVDDREVTIFKSAIKYII